MAPVHKTDNETANSLEEELKMCGQTNLLTSFQCNYCERKFPKKIDLKEHINCTNILKSRMDLLLLEKKLSEQVDGFVTSMHKLMQKEVSQIKKPCTCK